MLAWQQPFRQDLSRMYLAHYVLGSVSVMMTIIVEIILEMVT